MPRWVTRRNVDGTQVGEPIYCLRPGSIAAEPGIRSLEEGLALLLTDAERCMGESDKRPIRRGGTLVGYIDITIERPAGDDRAEDGRANVGHSSTDSQTSP